MIFFRLWKEKKIIKLGETSDEKEAKWYSYNEKLEKFLGYLKENDVVQIKTAQVGNKPTVIFLKKDDGESTPETETVSTDSTAHVTYEKKDYGSFQENKDEQIKRLSIMRAVGDAVVALAGQITKDEVAGFMTNLYTTLKKKVEE